MATAAQYDAFRESWRPTQEKVDQAIKLAVEIAKPSRVYIFGSWARGEATIDSDLDLAVFINDDRREQIGSLRRQVSDRLHDIPMSIDLVMASEGYVAEFLDSVNSVYYKIVNRGKLVYENQNR